VFEQVFFNAVVGWDDTELTKKPEAKASGIRQMPVGKFTGGQYSLTIPLFFKHKNSHELLWRRLKLSFARP